MKGMNEWWRNFFKSFYYAMTGIIFGFKERNMKIHGLVAVVVVGVGWCLNLSLVEWSTILILIGLVFTAELINTSIEELANVVKKNNNDDYEVTKTTRNLAAGAVLVMAMISAVVGLLIFLPKLL